MTGNNTNGQTADKELKRLKKHIIVEIIEYMQSPDRFDHMRQFALTIVRRNNLTMIKYCITICFFES